MVKPHYEGEVDRFVESVPTLEPPADPLRIRYYFVTEHKLRESFANLSPIERIKVVGLTIITFYIIGLAASIFAIGHDILFLVSQLEADSEFSLGVISSALASTNSTASIDTITQYGIRILCFLGIFIYFVIATYSRFLGSGQFGGSDELAQMILGFFIGVSSNYLGLT